MGLAQTQEVLAQLYTNTDLRERFFANPETVGAELGLSCDEAQKLAQLSAKEVNIFANSLKWKRLGEVRQLLPRTARALGKNFTALFWRYAQTHVPKGIKKHKEDAIAFANFIFKVAQEENLDPFWISDLVRYEKTWLLAYEPTSRLIVCWFGYPVGIASAEGMKRQPTIAIWFRFSKRLQLRHIVRSL
ncbi:hypothetical protein NIES4072_53810 [Nostoc commune NIES-4072]|uniref:SCO6045-like C-terminal domain-containing protein n=1 Tax=Nostoc commune NIES-4072 TaxID=2005467 RepID=A0A2R5FZM8_NOSCO|nr:hypothetical protein [Nostoc commune]BBD67325.1 hypothetical protein NIES4070_37140 [Nostoc commune HK-02]GBG21693.1 hypothetical protein NIES4072_53810 [Nostoc commune NIES-4072]